VTTSDCRDYTGECEIGRVEGRVSILGSCFESECGAKNKRDFTMGSALLCIYLPYSSLLLTVGVRKSRSTMLSCTCAVW
jgi:hypothetical protein